MILITAIHTTTNILVILCYVFCVCVQRQMKIRGETQAKVIQATRKSQRSDIAWNTSLFHKKLWCVMCKSLKMHVFRLLQCIRKR